jgi:hypothetical protein
MSTTTDKECELLGETQWIEDHEHDLIQDLGRRLGYMWWYDRCIANADGRPDLQDFWRDAKTAEQQYIERLKQLIKQHTLNIS